LAAKAPPIATVATLAERVTGCAGSASLCWGI